MDALFVIPALISPTVPERLIPGLAKMVERNTLLTHSSQIRIAAMRKYAGILSTATTESEEPLTEGPKVDAAVSASKEILGKAKDNVHASGIDIDAGSILSGGRATDDDSRKTAPHTIGDTQTEVPKGISFYNVVSLEPTFMEIPIEVKSNIFGVVGIGGHGNRIVRIGIKCVPYRIDGVDNIVTMLKDSANIAATKSMLDRKLESLAKRSFLNPTNRKIYKGEESSGDVVTDIIMGPSSEDLSNPRILASLMSARHSAKWSSLVMFTTLDFQGDDMSHLMGMYRSVVKAGWGDMVIVDENREGVYFCTTKTMACSLMPYNYLRQILKMDNVIDYRETSSLTRPFKMVSVRAAMRDL